MRAAGLFVPERDDVGADNDGHLVKIDTASRGQRDARGVEAKLILIGQSRRISGAPEIQRSGQSTAVVVRAASQGKVARTELTGSVGGQNVLFYLKLLATLRPQPHDADHNIELDVS